MGCIRVQAAYVSMTRPTAHRPAELKTFQGRKQKRAARIPLLWRKIKNPVSMVRVMTPHQYQWNNRLVPKVRVMTHQQAQKCLLGSRVQGTFLIIFEFVDKNHHPRSMHTFQYDKLLKKRLRNQCRMLVSGTSEIISSYRRTNSPPYKKWVTNSKGAPILRFH